MGVINIDFHAVAGWLILLHSSGGIEILKELGPLKSLSESKIAAEM